ncbi:hypothetical protein ABL78_1095 [Leptomonas seymouri]|uniref:Uncharacterized protein n=1 Tax=Leptomonas seymouri TaxID=5684 RepID=A0A0N1I2R7_LEPSE|nr:hypothetical protein ABL78_1095 [Leptomonas seymouri]|eukprot:KPI89832.1 hypothetical protein ABL78_1095 [Leptomonas seymouri]
MTDVAYIVRCQRCGVARKSFNDPRRGISVIECKRPCGNSHYEWTLVRTIQAAETWPPEPPEKSDILLYVPPTCRPPLPTAEHSASPSPAHASAEQDKDAMEKAEFESKGSGSVSYSHSTSADVKVTLKPSATGIVQQGGGSANGEAELRVSTSDAQPRKVKGGCVVQ